ncbi:SIP domain-containing protein [Microbacterium sp. LjRoot45]|uniref:SIP domain-containing protein n=1 Tax=Microbacterium sp. LjRoot45 TaxID=3342329 RepID=UPI003ED080A7
MSTMPTTAPGSVAHGPGVCRAAKHTRVQHLITADDQSLGDLELLLSTLPICSTGRVFVEVPDAAAIGELVVPPRMIVTWLDRSSRSGAPGSGRACAPGQALARAVTAWADEMLCDDEQGHGHHTQVHLLGGFLGTADILDHLTDVLGMDADGIHTPARFGLATSR